ncbi:NUDIX domain-containing protein [Dactylosporangium sp. NPDC048998]|uniref:NUDIX domain-containing protein n=1 Tax=Dactylosporangium sp. NPDC048998 TaxID=3363976 RepID=UPI0037130152
MTTLLIIRRLWLTYAPGNTTAIATWRRLGFRNLPGDYTVDGMQVITDCKGPGQKPSRLPAWRFRTGSSARHPGWSRHMTTASGDRQALRDLVAGLIPVDEREAADRDDVLAWIDTGAELYRRVPPDVPGKHLVTYFLPYDEHTDRVFLVNHRKARRLLPPGGHVEPAERPWGTVMREADEELGAVARPHPLWPTERPLFVTVTQTVGHRSHTDATLWFPLLLASDQPITPDSGEFAGWGWYPRAEVIAWPAERTDPHLGRFLGKFGRLRNTAAEGAAHVGG